MNNINVSLSVTDMICTSNFKNILQKDVIVTSATQSICLNCDFLLNIIRVENNLFTIILQNGLQIYIRNIFENETFQICLPCKNGTRIITICGTMNSRN